MKENMIDVLLYLFQNYISDDSDMGSDRESVEQELLDAGFPAQEILRALEWLEGLTSRQETPIVVFTEERNFRIYTHAEMARLDVECRGFLLFLEQTGVLSSEGREWVIERVMALATDDIDLTQLKWIILMVLFNRPGQEEAYAWMEDLMFEDNAVYLH